MTTTKKDTPAGTPVLLPVMVQGGQPSTVDPETGYDPLHPSWATEIHRYVDESDHADLNEFVSFEGTDVNGARLAKVGGKRVKIGDLRNRLDELEVLAGEPHLRVDERSGDDATKAFNAGMLDEKPKAPDESATKADPDEVAKQAATRQRAAEATGQAPSRTSSKK